VTYSPEVQRMIDSRLNSNALYAELEDQAQAIEAYPLANIIMEQRFWPMIQCALHRGVALVSRLFI
jgi:hypothetical protein